jgi:hypothetical protein
MSISSSSGTKRGDAATVAAATFAPVGTLLDTGVGVVVGVGVGLVLGLGVVCTPPGENGRPASDVGGIRSTLRVDSS